MINLIVVEEDSFCRISRSIWLLSGSGPSIFNDLSYVPIQVKPLESYRELLIGVSFNPVNLSFASCGAILLVVLSYI